MNAPRQPDHDAEPDPDEPVLRREVTGCKECGRTIWRPAGRRDPGGWRHLFGDGVEDERP